MIIFTSKSFKLSKTLGPDVEGELHVCNFDFGGCEAQLERTKGFVVVACRCSDASNPCVDRGELLPVSVNELEKEDE